MIIEIRKAGFVNKGAELMLRTTLQQVSQAFPEAQFAMEPNKHIAPYEKRAQLGLLQKASYCRFRIQWDYIGHLIPRSVRTQYGIVLNNEVDAVLDVAGFEYTDKWGPRSCAELASSIKRYKRQGTKVILLPQAFGPFESNDNISAIKFIGENADLIFAREKISYKHLTDIVGQRPTIQIAPDFTNLTKGVIPSNFDSSNKKFCIVPNYRMVDKTNPAESSAYLPFLITCTNFLLKKDAKPFLLIHEGENDMRLAQEVVNSLEQEIPIVKETDPLKIKGILGTCNGTIGSRFHGLVSALSQGVPSLATGWSHKYKMLFEDYGFEEGLINPLASVEKIQQKIDILLDKASREKIRNTLLENSIRLKKETQQMWDSIFSAMRK